MAEAFKRLHADGLIYRGSYMVNWAPTLQTAVSDLEVEYTEETGKLFFFKCALPAFHFLFWSSFFLCIVLYFPAFIWFVTRLLTFLIYRGALGVAVDLPVPLPLRCPSHWRRPDAAKHELQRRPCTSLPGHDALL